MHYKGREYIEQSGSKAVVRDTKKAGRDRLPPELLDLPPSQRRVCYSSEGKSELEALKIM
jgi:hypothetical protein